MQTNKKTNPAGETFSVVNQIDKVSRSGNFCSMNCYNDWAETFIDRAIDHFGRLTEAKHLTEENAWYKDYDWDSSYNNRIHFFVNAITKERRPLTEDQYNDRNYRITERQKQ